MRLKHLFLIFLTAFVLTCDASQEVEARGKKKKIALFVYFADLVVKKIFILKLIYAFVFWLVIHKAGYFLAWFVSYLKEQKQHHHEYHDYQGYHGPHHEYGPSSGPSYGPSYGPYRRKAGSL